jgi:phosphoribosylcarboxyaminoimidazole (NCAIR) mutase
MRKIGIFLGSASDLKQCLKGLQYLWDAQGQGSVKVPFVRINSIHRNTFATLLYIFFLWLFSFIERIDAIIVGAGMANHLTGTTDAFLRYFLRSRRIVIIGVAFENAKDPESTQAAILSITKVPGTQVVFDNFVGAEGFFRACQFTVEGDLPELIRPAKKQTQTLTLREAIKEAQVLLDKAA